MNIWQTVLIWCVAVVLIICLAVWAMPAETKSPEVKDTSIDSKKKNMSNNFRIGFYCPTCKAVVELCYSQDAKNVRCICGEIYKIGNGEETSLKPSGTDSTLTIHEATGDIIGISALKNAWISVPVLKNIHSGKKPTAPTFDALLDAIEFVESGGKADAVGDDGQAIGAYQIHKIYVDDVNRILGENWYSYEDRWDKALSREMVRIYIRHWAFKFFGHPSDGGRPTFEAMARIHNGGPRGHKKESTKAYWLKIKKRLETKCSD